jgi:DNA repair protein RadA/Sms
MTKTKINYVCNECVYTSAQWLGKCPSCNSWNTFQEEIKSNNYSNKEKIKSVVPLNELSHIDEVRFSTGFDEFDRVLGGGIVKDSLTLLGGGPGIGKSTLLMQVCGNLSKLNKKNKILYITGEESETQVLIRSKRLKIDSNNILISNETNLENIKNLINQLKPTFLILDSIQTTISSEVNGAAGSLSQVKETIFEIMSISKSLGVTSIVIGHIVKDGSLAGPKILEHMVDTVVSFEIEKQNEYRILRSIKNRFGANSEVGIFEMNSDGLQEVKVIKRNRRTNNYGSAWSAVTEGNRIIFIEIQSLVNENKTSFGKRVCHGVDLIRVNLLIAIIEKYLNISLANFDIFINISEGISTKSASVDLCIISSILSSYLRKPVSNEILLIGEVGLTGFITPEKNLEKLVSHIKGQGFTSIFTGTDSTLKEQQTIEFFKLNSLSMLASALFQQKWAA